MFISVSGTPPEHTWHSSYELVPITSKVKLVKFSINTSFSLIDNSLYFLFLLIEDLFNITATNLLFSIPSKISFIELLLLKSFNNS